MYMLKMQRPSMKKLLHALRISVGNALCMIFVFVPRLQFPGAYLASVLYVMTAAMLADTAHVGSSIIGAVLILESGVVAGLLAAFVLLLSGNNDTVLLLLTCLVVIPACISLRFGKNPR